MRTAVFSIPMLALALPVCAAAAEVTGEWSNEPDNCDEMRVVYRDNGEHPTEINAGGEWVEVSDAIWEREGDVIYVTAGGRTDAWDIVHLDDERMHLVNQDPEAEEFGVGETELFRCPPR